MVVKYKVKETRSVSSDLASKGGIATQVSADADSQANPPELLLLISSEGKVLPEDIRGFNDFIKKYIEGETPFKLMIDIRKIDNYINPDVMKEIKDNLDYYNKIEVGKVIVIGILISNSVIETLANLVFSLCPPITPIKLSKDLNVICDFINEY